MEQSDQPSLMRSLEELNPVTIEECCEKGDEMAIEVYRITGRKLGVTIADYATILNPEAIIFTGGIANASHWLFDPLQESFDKHVFKNIRGKVKILRSKFNSYERDMLGASALAWGIKEYSLFK
jgi:glucokinase